MTKDATNRMTAGLGKTAGGTEAWSEDYIRSQIPKFKWFIHVPFGNGIVARSTHWPDAPFDSRHMGVGKFEFIVRRNLPDLQGLRVLDLGCNAGVIAIHMARLGALEVVGVDCERGWPGWKEQAAFVKGALEWRCRTVYPVSYVECDLAALPEVDLGKFDAVTALNCLYYLEEAQIVRLVRHLATITPHVVIQCNTRDQKALGRRAFPAFFAQVLQENGFGVRIDWPWDHPRGGVLPRRYARPVVVGVKESGPAE
jgi:2-polyprenyl-3-methyl-5-hydroxy-6-metoxy-1,4-benzoquinol methylase